jgi:hypothetical protein
MWCQDTLLCEYTFKTGLKKDTKCGKLNCVIHEEYDGNLGLFLDLPKRFLDFGKFKGFNYFTLVSVFNKAEKYELTKKEIVEYIKYILELHENLNDIKYRLLLSIYIFRFLDIDHVNLLVVSNSNFKNVVDNKVLEFCNVPRTETILKKYTKYCLTTFETGKKFLSKQKNKTYLINIFKRYVRLVIIANHWFQETLKKRYSPDGGIGFKLCFESWTLTVNSK